MTVNNGTEHQNISTNNPSYNFADLLAKDSNAGNYDYIIVGAGSAGCVIARRLIDQTNAKVLLLEAGGSHAGISRISNPLESSLNRGTDQDYAYHYEPTPFVNNRALDLPRGKVLGGSGSINVMVWSRGNKYDYDGWAALGNKGWDYESVLPLFKKIEDWEGGETDFHGAGGPIRVERAKDHLLGVTAVAAAESFGIPYIKDINGPSPEGIGRGVMNVKDGLRHGPTAYLDPVMDHENLTILLLARVLKLNFEGTRCTGLDFVQNENTYTVKASGEVILCAGAVDTPRILMLSGIGKSEDLRALGIDTLVNLPGVGENLQDHPILQGLCFEANEPLQPYNGNALSSTIHWKSHYELPFSDLMIFAAQVPIVLPNLARLYPPIPPNSFSLVPALVRSQSRGYLKMRTSRHDGPLEIQGNILADPADVNALVEAVRLCYDLVSKPAFKQLIRNWIIPQHQLDDRKSIVNIIREGVKSYSHIVGTCAMGNGKEAVVSDQLLVYGVDGLRIADASVMPKITSCNTQAPTMMIAEFAARLIVGK